MFVGSAEFDPPQPLSEPLLHQSAAFPGGAGQGLLLAGGPRVGEQAGGAGLPEAAAARRALLQDPPRAALVQVRKRGLAQRSAGPPPGHRSAFLREVAGAAGASWVCVGGMGKRPVSTLRFCVQRRERARWFATFAQTLCTGRCCPPGLSAAPQTHAGPTGRGAMSLVPSAPAPPEAALALLQLRLVCTTLMA